MLELYLHLNQGLICRFQKSLTTSADSILTIHTHYPYAFYRPHHLRFQIPVLALSLLKSLEIYTFFLLGGALVGILSGVPFLFSFVSGVCLEIYGIITSCRPIEINGHLDLIAASPLPNAWVAHVSPPPASSPPARGGSTSYMPNRQVGKMA